MPLILLITIIFSVVKVQVNIKELERCSVQISTESHCILYFYGAYSRYKWRRRMVFIQKGPFIFVCINTIAMSFKTQWKLLTIRALMEISLKHIWMSFGKFIYVLNKWICNADRSFTPKQEREIKEVKGFYHLSKRWWSNNEYIHILAIIQK